MVTQELVVDFVNTLHEGEEALAAPADLTAWLADRGLVSGRVGACADDLEAAHAAREALRTLMLANNDVEVDRDAATAVLDRVALRARVELRFVGGAPELVPAAPGALGGLGQILAAVQAMTLDGSWGSLKACRARDCEWAFVDTARNQSRAWCSMRSCGNREKARAFRERGRSTGV